MCDIDNILIQFKNKLSNLYNLNDFYKIENEIINSNDKLKIEKLKVLRNIINIKFNYNNYC